MVPECEFHNNYFIGNEMKSSIVNEILETDKLLGKDKKAIKNRHLW